MLYKKGEKIMLYVYESHLGGLYCSEHHFSQGSLYCEECGDSDWCIGRFASASDVIAYLANDIKFDDNDNYGLWDLNDVLTDLSQFKDVPSIEEAKSIVMENRSKEYH